MKKKIHYALLEDMKKYAKDLIPLDDLEVGTFKTDTTIIRSLRNYYSQHLPIDITAWVRVNDPDDNLIFKKRFSSQVIFLRDVLAPLFYTTIDEYDSNPVMVISTHMSKSILLPVYQILSKRYGIEMILRDNFYNWKVSINSSFPIEFNFLGLFDSKLVIPAYYCEGFPEEKVYGSYNENHSQFTFEILSDYNLYTFAFLLAKYLEKKVDV